jgi:hypothetical protein
MNAPAFLGQSRDGATDSLVMTGATADELWPLVRDYHYSRRMPSAIQHCFAVREPGGLFGDTGRAVAGVIFGCGANRTMPTGSMELTRLVRTPDCVIPLSGFVTWAMRWLRANTIAPFVFSYADTAQDHHGGIYQASGFVYTGESKPQFSSFFDAAGKPLHKRSLSAQLGTAARDVVLAKIPGATIGTEKPKHLYIFPLRQKWPTIARRYGWEAKPYPKPHAARPLDASGAPGIEAGATPAGRSNSQVQP